MDAEAERPITRHSPRMFATLSMRTSGSHENRHKPTHCLFQQEHFPGAGEVRGGQAIEVYPGTDGRTGRIAAVPFDAIASRRLTRVDQGAHARATDIVNGQADRLPGRRPGPVRNPVLDL